MSSKSRVQITEFCSCAEEEAAMQTVATRSLTGSKKESGPNKQFLGFSFIYTKSGVQIIIFSSCAEEEAAVQPATAQPDWKQEGEWSK
jgi:hypothetical protein